jgi:hypothetical protein
MIRSLRRRHRFAALGLALLLPPALVVALAARAPAPVVARPLAPSLGERAPAIARDRVPLPAPAGEGLAVAVGRDPGGARVVEIDARGTAALPDALVYWSAVRVAESLPAESFFLGVLPDDGVRAYRLPAAAVSRPGFLVVFSVAWQKLLLAQSLDPEARP